MNSKKALLPALLLASVLTLGANAQRRAATPKFEDLPKLPVDTLSTDDPDTKVIIFANNTWEYYRPRMAVYDELPVYSGHWNNDHIFSYRDIELTDLPDVTDLCLVLSLSEYHHPIKGQVRSKYGTRRRRNHNGVDIPLKTGDPIYATFEGKIRYSKYNSGGYGNLVIIRHKNGLETWYAHLTKSNVQENEYVKAGQVIGYGGNTGRSTGPHLHYEIRYCDQTFDPEFLVDFPTGRLKTETFALQRSYFNIHSRASELLVEDDDEDGYTAEDLLDPSLPLLAELGDSTAIRLLASVDFKKKQAEAQRQEELKKAKYHTIKSGDMLGKLSGLYGISVSELCRLNNISATTTLRLGQRIRVR